MHVKGGCPFPLKQVQFCLDNGMTVTSVGLWNVCPSMEKEVFLIIIHVKEKLGQR